MDVATMDFTTMEIRAEFDRVTADMDEKEILSTVWAVLQELLGGTPNSPPPPVLVPAVLELNAQHQPIDSNGGGCNACALLGEDPTIFEEPWSPMSAPIMYHGGVCAEDMQTGYPCSQGQYLPFMWSGDGVMPAAAFGHAAAPPAFVYLGEDPTMVEELLSTMSAPIMYHGGVCGAEDLQTDYPCSQGQYLPLMWSGDGVMPAAAFGHAAAPSPPTHPMSWSTVSAPTMYDGAVSAENMQPDYPCSQAGSYSQGQYLPLMWSGDGVMPAAAFGHAAAPPPPTHPNNDLFEGQELCYFGMLNEPLLYKVEEDHSAPPGWAASPPNASTSRKGKFDKQEAEHKDSRPYVARPLNAFMLFLKEQRADVKLSEWDESGGSASVNKILGQRWSSMTREDKDKYYDMARKQKELHAQQHPKWSSNYGKRRRRNMVKGQRF